MQPSEEVQMTPAVELIGLGMRTDSYSLMATSRGSSSHSINTQQPVFVMWGCFPSSCVVLCTCLQELKAHILPLTNVAFDKSGSRWVGKPRRRVLCRCVCSCVTRATACTCSGSWRAATTGRVVCGTRPRAASCTRCRVTGTWCTPWPSTTPTGNLLQFAVPDTRGRPRSTTPAPALVLAGTRSPPAPLTRRASCGAQRAGNVSTPSADTGQKLCVQDNSTLQQIHLFIYFWKTCFF